MKSLGRLLLAFVLAVGSVYCMVAFAAAPYEIVTTTSTYVRAIPDGSGLWVGALIFAVLAVVVAFSGDWHS